MNFGSSNDLIGLGTVLLVACALMLSVSALAEDDDNGSTSSYGLEYDDVFTGEHIDFNTITVGEYVRLTQGQDVYNYGHAAISLNVLTEE